MIALNRVTQPGHVAENGRRHRAGSEDATRPSHTRPEKANGRKQFPDALHPAHPRFSALLAPSWPAAKCRGRDFAVCRSGFVASIKKPSFYRLVLRFPFTG